MDNKKNVLISIMVIGCMLLVLGIASAYLDSNKLKKNTPQNEVNNNQENTVLTPENKEVAETATFVQEVINNTTEPEETVEILDCKEDKECFINAANNCELAKFTLNRIVEKDPLSESYIDATFEYQIGKKDDVCFATSKVLDYKITFNEAITKGKTATEIKEMEAFIVEGSKKVVSVCKTLENKKLGDTLNNTTFDPVKSYNASCEVDQVSSTCTYESQLVCENKSL